MNVPLTLTAAGRAALADGAHRATRAVQLRRLAIGTGTAAAGTDDSARAALRAQREIVAATGSTAVPARIAVRADFSPSATYSVTEVGLFARIGDAGAEFLFAYWVGANAAAAIAATVSGTTLVVAGIVEIVASAADITVTLSPAIQVGAPGQATTSVLGLVELATTAEAAAGRDAIRAVTPAGLASRTPNASTSRRGLLELATLAEARAGRDATRAVTPAGLRSAVPVVMTPSERGKLAGIEADATADQTGAEIRGLLDAALGSANWRGDGGTGWASNGFIKINFGKLPHSVNVHHVRFASAYRANPYAILSGREVTVGRELNDPGRPLNISALSRTGFRAGTDDNDHWWIAVGHS